MELRKYPKPKIKRKKKKILGDASRVLARAHIPAGEDRLRRIIKHVIDLTDNEANELLTQILLDFSKRHKNIKHVFDRHYDLVKNHLDRTPAFNDTQKKLIGAYFTMEYSIESAALFNPSIVPHPDQSSTKDRNQRFIMSLRATGEGHISSIVFRSGVLDQDNSVRWDPVNNYVSTPDLHVNKLYDRHLFQLKLNEMAACDETTGYVLERLPESFTMAQLKDEIEPLRAARFFSQTHQNEAFEIMYWLANSNYEMAFRPGQSVSERVIFPVSENESRGIEDARFVQFKENDSDVTYYATYTAYNGVSILPQLIETKDFVHFTISTLNGKAVQNKGMALFPRKIGNRYVMLSRQDGENNHIMFSDNIHFWQESKVIQVPTYPWEFIQIGNCGSPLETEEGWIVLTHGVGPMRQYSIGAILLDLENPEKVIARLVEPLLIPQENEREGYVPNVVYSCGAIIHNDELVIPYAMSDIMSGIATVEINDLLDCMQGIVC